MVIASTILRATHGVNVPWVGLAVPATWKVVMMHHVTMVYVTPMVSVSVRVAGLATRALIRPAPIVCMVVSAIPSQASVSANKATVVPTAPSLSPPVLSRARVRAMESVATTAVNVTLATKDLTAPCPLA